MKIYFGEGGRVFHDEKLQALVVIFLNAKKAGDEQAAMLACQELVNMGCEVDFYPGSIGILSPLLTEFER